MSRREEEGGGRREEEEGGGKRKKEEEGGGGRGEEGGGGRRAIGRFCVELGDPPQFNAKVPTCTHHRSKSSQFLFAKR